MKLLRFSLLMFLASSICLAQNTVTPTGVVQDSDSQAWINGTWSWTLYNPSGGGSAKYIDGSNVPKQTSGSLDATGAFSGGSIPNNAKILPTGTQANITVCSVTSAPNACQTVRIPITSDSPTIGSIVSSLILPPRVEAAKSNYAYNATEILNPVQGTGYTNTVTNSCFLWQNGSYVSCGGASSGTVQAAPQYRHFVQPNPGTAAVAAGSTTAINAVDPIAQGIGNTDLFATGAGNNGIANFFAMYPTGQAVVPPTSTDTENLGTIFQANLALPTSASLDDYRGGGIVRYRKNPSISNSPCNNSLLFTVLTINCDAPISTGNLDSVSANGSIYYVAGAGYNSGNNGSSAGGWSTFHDINLAPTYLTRGIKQAISVNQTTHSAGDDDMLAIYDNVDGGCERLSDECVKGAVIYPSENTSYFHGTISSGGTTGSTSLTTTNTSGQNAFTDEGYLLDITKGSLTATYLSEGLQDGFNVVNYNGSSLPVSTAWGTLNSGTTSSANGKYQIYVSQTITMTLSADSPGSFAVGNNACIVSPRNTGGFVEQIPITAIVAPSGNQQQITFSTRYGWNAGAFIMQGGMCGQIATNQATPTWRAGSLVVGSFSATQILIGSCSSAQCNDPNVYNGALGLNVASAVTAFFPGAEIIGTANGTPNFVQLANNTVAWANNDVIENPHPADVSIRGVDIGVVQKSNTNGTDGAFGADIYWKGPNCTSINCTVLSVDPPQSGLTMNSLICMGCLNNTYGTVNAAIVTPAGTGVATIWENFSPPVTHYIYQTTEGNRIASFYVGGTGDGFGFTRNQDGAEVPVFASNTPTANATASGQIVLTQPLVGSGYPSSFVAISGDCGLIYTGVLTCTKINGVTISGTPISGQTPVASGSTTAAWGTPSAGLRGRSTLVSGTVTVSSTAAGATMPIQLSNCSPSGTAIGLPTLGTIVAGTSFVINSTSATNTLVTGDNSTICWFIPN